MEEKLPQEEENLPNNVEEELVFGYGASAIFLVFAIYTSFIR